MRDRLLLRVYPDAAVRDVDGTQRRRAAAAPGCAAVPRLSISKLGSSLLRGCSCTNSMNVHPGYAPRPWSTIATKLGSIMQQPSRFGRRRAAYFHPNINFRKKLASRKWAEN